MQVLAQDKLDYNELLEATGRLFNPCTYSQDDDHDLGPCIEPAVAASNTFPNISAGTDESLSSEYRVGNIALAVKSIHLSAASAGIALTEATWQAVWDWKATPGNGI